MIRAMASAARVFVDKRSLLIIPMLFYFGVIASTILADYSTVSCDLTANIFSQGHSLYFPSFILIYGGSGERVLGLGFLVDGVLGLWCGALWVFEGWGSFFLHRRINLGIKVVLSYLLTVLLAHPI